MTSSLADIRHSFAHLLAAAVLLRHKDAKITLGPSIEHGFYYDIAFPKGIKLGEAELVQISNDMRTLHLSWGDFSHRTISEQEARVIYKENPYKLELIDEIVARGEPITLYKNGDFEDLCRGGHADSSEMNLDAMRLTHVAGAYWRGDEKRDMLTRIYGLAFSSKEELDTHLTRLEEAKERDHRKVGKELGLFTFSPIVGAGLPLWLPKGATVRRVLERFIVDTELEWGYLHVYTPDIAKIDLYKTSGHYPYYKDSMYAPIQIDEDEFMLRPMTCPHHFQIYKDSPKSYRDLPMRIAELAKLYRYEASGELSGLVRVRSFCLADAHIICTGKEQAIQEVGKALDLIEHVAGVFGLTKGTEYSYRLSLGDRSDDKKYYKNDLAWDEAEAALRELLTTRGAPFVEAPQEAAFYGPKIDIQMKDVRGKENTAFTVQYDFCMPDRFDLTFNDSDGKEKRAVVVHRSSIGAIERVMAFLIEHYAGNFPLWLSPTQVAIIPISEAHHDYALRLDAQLKKLGLRTELMAHKDSLGKKIRTAKGDKTPYTLVIGDAEVSSHTVTLESRELGKIGTITIDELTSRLMQEVESKGQKS
jgi:threonyl-tRNA synthetase